jgi:aconitate hydratase
MGILPLQFRALENRKSHKLDGTETFDVIGDPSPGCDLTLVVNRVDGSFHSITVTCRLDTAEETLVYSAGGILQRFAQDFLESTSAT